MHSQLLHNRWFGKAVGTACACIWGPADAVGFSVAIICGIAVGHLYDWWAYRQLLKDTEGFASVPKGVKGRQALETPHLKYLFAAMGTLAKANGIVRKAHIDAAERLMRRLQLDTAGRKQAIDWFNQGKTSNIRFNRLARECLGADAREIALRNLMLESMCEIAAITPTPPVLGQLKQLGTALGFSKGRVGEVFGEAHVQVPRVDMPQESAKSTVPREVLQAADTLSVSVDEPLEGVKRAYRRLVSRCHPDKLGAHASADAVSNAQREMIALREALEVMEHFKAS
jgi:DnaJ like chaperone protein